MRTLVPLYTAKFRQGRLNEEGMKAGDEKNGRGTRSLNWRRGQPYCARSLIAESRRKETRFAAKPRLDHAPTKVSHRFLTPSCLRGFLIGLLSCPHGCRPKLPTTSQTPPVPAMARRTCTARTTRKSFSIGGFWSRAIVGPANRVASL
jgi:hypothetical protein